jgi:[ribosomal protein S18]-alanine N-acetyltransferase
MIGLPFGPFSQRHFVIESLVPADCRNLGRIHAETFRHPWSEDDFHNLLSQKAVFGFIAREEGKPRGAVGFVVARLTIDEAEILTIAVSPHCRRKGVGRMLMDAVLRYLHRERARSLFLEVDQANIAAQALYRRLGFAKVGERPGYYATDAGRSAALILRRDFHHPE